MVYQQKTTGLNTARYSGIKKMPINECPLQISAGCAWMFRLDPQVVQTVQLEHCYWSVAMGTIVPVVGTVELVLFQGRVAAILTDMGSLGAVPLVPWRLEHNSLEGVG